MRINVLNRDNICEMEGVCDANGQHFHRDNGSYPCFHAAFSFMDQPGNVSKTYTIDYKLHMRKNYDNRNNNFVVLSKKDMCRLLNSFKMSIPFTYHFEENEIFYILHMHLAGTSLQHKGLLMLSRMLFEYPHNICGSDILKLRALGKADGFDFKKMSLTSLYTLCISSTEFSYDECIIDNNTPELIGSRELGRRLGIKNRRVISNVLREKYYNPEVIYFTENSEVDLGNEGFNRRYATYKHNLELNRNA